MRATALVLLVGCWRSTPRSEPPPPPPPADAAPDATLDAAVDIDAPPVPIDARSGPPTARCPGGIVGRVIAVQVQGSDTIVTIGVGKNHGVADTWVATFVSPRAPMRLIRVDTYRTIASLTLTMDQIRSSPYVELCPP